MNKRSTQFQVLKKGILPIFVFGFVFCGADGASASDIAPERVVELTNQDRTKQSIAALSVDDKLTQAAQAKADDMADNSYFAHTSPSGVTPWYWIRQSGYDYRYAGENLAAHFADAEDQERAWMESVKHRENILNPNYRDIGVAVKRTTENGQSTLIVVQMFGAPSGVVLSSRTEIGEMSRSEDIRSVVVTSPTPKHETVSEDSPVAIPRIGTAQRSIQGFGLLATMLMIGIGYASVVESWKSIHLSVANKKRFHEA